MRKHGAGFRPGRTTSWRQASESSFITLRRTLGAWKEQILNYFDDRVTNAFAEGITNKVKVIKRSAYGFRNPMRYRPKVLLACGHRRLREVNHHPTCVG